MDVLIGVVISVIGADWQGCPPHARQKNLNEE